MDWHRVHSTTMEYDEFLVKVGIFGRYQKICFALLFVAYIPGALLNFSIVFQAALPDHLCLNPNEGWNGSSDVTVIYEEQRQNFSGVELFTNITLTQCEIITTKIEYDSSDNVMFFNDTAFGQHRNTASTTTSSSCTSWVYNKEEYHSTIATEWDLVCSDEWMVAIPKSVYMVGYMVGASFCGIIADRYGRRIVIISMAVLQVVVGISAAFSPNFVAFVIFKFLIGMSRLALSTTLFISCMEINAHKNRNLLSTALFIAWSIGYIIIAGLAYACRDWWTIQLGSMCAPIVVVFIVFFVPQSPRWLLTHKRKEEAQKLIAKMIRVNKANIDESVQLELKEAKRLTNPLDLFRTGRIRKIVLLMFYIWPAMSLLYYGLSLNTSNLGGDTKLNFFIAAAIEIPAYLLCFLLLVKCGRKWPQIILNIIATVFLVATIPIPPYLNAVSIAFAMIGKFAVSASYGLLYIHTAELFPTVVRSMGMSAVSCVGRIGGIIVPFILELRLLYKSAPLIIFAVAAGLMAVALFFLPETKGIKLPDTIDESIAGRIYREDKRSDDVGAHPLMPTKK